MTLARVGIAVALVGALALATHVRFRAKRAQQQLDCAAWRHAQEILASVEPERHWDWRIPGLKEQKLVAALDDPDMRELLRARQLLVSDPQLTWALLPALRDPTFVGLRNAGGFCVDGRAMCPNMPLDYGEIDVTDDLFRRAGRASWLLKQVTGHYAPDVRVQTDRLILADLARDWEEWLDGMEGGKVCSLSPSLERRSLFAALTSW